jgi:hypothetical protein
VYRDFFSFVHKAFLANSLEKHQMLLWNITAAVLHIQSDNWEIAEELIGCEKGALTKALIEYGSDIKSLCNALFHKAAKIIIEAAFR